MKRALVMLTVALLLSACGDEQTAGGSAPPAPAAIEPAPVKPDPLPGQSRPAPAVVPVPKKASPEVTPGQPSVALDLSVPPELIHELRMGESLDPQPPRPLLPPLFIEKPKPASPFQLSGKLMINEQIDDDYAKSVEGAELQLQFKH